MTSGARKDRAAAGAGTKRPATAAARNRPTTEAGGDSPGTMRTAATRPEGRTATETGRIAVGISSCLLGQKVRFDGGHKRDPYLIETLGRYFLWVPVCPEVEIGLGTPRESLRLLGTPAAPRLVAPRSGADHTGTMRAWSRGRLDALAGQALRGYVLKKDSPSCGMERVRVYNASGMAERKGRGLFAAALMERDPLLPVEEEGRLHDLPLRENWIERVFAYDRWTRFLASAPKSRDLVAFHTRHKLTLMAHSVPHLRRLGKIVADGRALDRARLAEYGALFVEALRMRATTRKHTNVLQHMAGFLKKPLDGADRAELVEVIEAYHLGRVPLVVPLTLLQHHFRRHPVDWLTEQVYLNPYPDELMLRNHV